MTTAGNQHSRAVSKPRSHTHTRPTQTLGGKITSERRAQSYTMQCMTPAVSMMGDCSVALIVLPRAAGTMCPTCFTVALLHKSTSILLQASRRAGMGQQPWRGFTWPIESQSCLTLLPPSQELPDVMRSFSEFTAC